MSAGGSNLRIKPVLLSALAFPGLGQLAQRRYVAAALQALLTAAFVVLLLGRVWVEAHARIPSDPDEVAEVLVEDPAWPFELAQQIERDNASYFRWLLAGMVAVWAWSVADAWRAGRGAPPR